MSECVRYTAARRSAALRCASAAAARHLAGAVDMLRSASTGPEEWKQERGCGREQQQEQGRGRAQQQRSEQRQ